MEMFRVAVEKASRSQVIFLIIFEFLRCCFLLYTVVVSLECPAMRAWH